MMLRMKVYLRYSTYLWWHKYYVYQAGRARGLGRLRLIFHDWSKFLPDEWFPYAEWFYGYHGESWYKAPQEAPGRAERYDRYQHAWNRHQKRHKHHWQNWLLYNDDGSLVALDMPEADTIEMVADWEGAGRSISRMTGGGISDAKEWYLKQKSEKKHTLHPKTRWRVERLLGLSLIGYEEDQYARNNHQNGMG